jgi:hypothetical protein
MGTYKKVYFPKLRLTEKVMAAGGITREDAVTAATQNVQSISAEGDTVMAAAIQEIEKIITGSGGRLDAPAMSQILVHADQVITLSGTFGYDYLDRASRSLCDTIECLMAANSSELAPVAVHADAMRLFAPGKDSPQGAAAEGVLAELARVHAHYRHKL